MGGFCLHTLAISFLVCTHLGVAEMLTHLQGEDRRTQGLSPDDQREIKA